MLRSLAPKFDKIINARDLGGLPGAGGRLIRPGLLLRTASLSDASDADVKLLQEKYNLRRIFDFRTLEEIQRQPDREIPGAEHISLPTLDVEAERKSGDAVPEEFYADVPKYIVHMSFHGVVQRTASQLYPSLVQSEYSQLQYSVFLNLILQTEEGAVLWHCSQGKDRTGIGAAFVLAALGADRETIVADFDHSNLVYRELIEDYSHRILAEGGGENELNVVRAFLGAHTGNFCRVLDYIDREWGSLHNYLNTCLSVTDEDMEVLRERYLE